MSILTVCPDIPFPAGILRKGAIWRAFAKLQSKASNSFGIRLAKEVFKELSEVERLAQLGRWHWDSEADRVTWSDQVFRIVGRNPSWPAPCYKELRPLYTPESWEQLQRSVAEALRTGTPYELDLQMVRPDGTTRWVCTRGEAERNGIGRITRLRGTVQDITEKKQAEEKLHELSGRLAHALEELEKSEEKFVKAFRESPVALTITSAKDHRYLDVSKSFERWSGWRRDEVIGRTPFDIAIWVNPAQRLEFVRRILAGGVVRNLEFRCRRKHGMEMVGLGSGELIEIANEPCVISAIADITDRKRAEEALSGVSRQLVEAQEQERSRIGRELHDDVSQRLALLSMSLGQLEKKNNLPLEVRDGIQELRQTTSNIATDIHALSHELHPSNLEYLGLVSGVRGWCEQYAKQHKLEIDFKSDELPLLRQEFSLCLFRVLQEALHNAAKYSGVKRIEVLLAEKSGEVHLIVRDSGKGFDIDAARRNGGLGLTSMQERVRLIGGTMVIESKPRAGTVVHVWVRVVQGRRRRLKLVGESSQRARKAA